MGEGSCHVSGAWCIFMVVVVPIAVVSVVVSYIHDIDALAFAVVFVFFRFFAVIAVVVVTVVAAAAVPVAEAAPLAASLHQSHEQQVYWWRVVYLAKLERSQERPHPSIKYDRLPLRHTRGWCSS